MRLLAGFKKELLDAIQEFSLEYTDDKQKQYFIPTRLKAFLVELEHTIDKAHESFALKEAVKLRVERELPNSMGLFFLCFSPAIHLKRKLRGVLSNPKYIDAALAREVAMESREHFLPVVARLEQDNRMLKRSLELITTSPSE